MGAKSELSCRIFFKSTMLINGEMDVFRMFSQFILVRPFKPTLFVCDVTKHTFTSINHCDERADYPEAVMTHKG